MAPIKRTTHSNNKEYCKRYREKDKEKYEQNDAECKRYQRMLTMRIKKKKNRERMRLARELKKQAQQQSPEPSTNQAYCLNKTIQVPKFTSCRGEPSKQSKQDNWITCKKVQHENST